MVVIGGMKDKVCGEGEVVDPVGMCGEVVC